jgi:hypothetical protein
MTRPAIRCPGHFWTGLLLTCFGLGFWLYALTYELGSATRIGPGTFPLALAVVLSLIGIASAVRSFLRAGSPVGRIALVPMVLVLGASVVFGASLKGVGLAAAVIVVVFVSARASLRFRWSSAILLAGAMSASAVLVFAYALRLPIPVVGRWLTG